jgi:hypothetical protein
LLWEDKGVTVYPADKGNATVTVTANNYHSKTVTPKSSHTWLLTIDPAAKIEGKTMAFIK